MNGNFPLLLLHNIQSRVYKLVCHGGFAPVSSSTRTVNPTQYRMSHSSSDTVKLQMSAAKKTQKHVLIH